MANFVEGYWWSKWEPRYPKPVASDFLLNKDAIIVALKKKESKATRISYRGWSTCRCCNISNGSREYKSGDWVWPEGLLHYIEEHNVKPSDEFLKFLGVISPNVNI